MAMLFREFSEANKKRCEADNGFRHKLNDWSTSDWLVALLGEAGEACNVAKKLNRFRDGIAGNKEKEADLRIALRRELADVFVYLDLVCQSLGFTVDEAAVEVFNAKSEEIGYPVKLVS